MIIVPEIEAVVILTPRCGSGALRDALLAKYPKAMMIYRHMEADGIPQGYDRWRRFGVVRDPLDRLWSLFKFLQKVAAHQPRHDGKGKWEPAYVESLRRSLDNRTFDDWIVSNETVFTSPYDSAGLGRFWPTFTVRHPLPENRKSQFIYLRPDLGTEVWQFAALDRLARYLSVSLADETSGTMPHRTDNSQPPALSAAARDHMGRYFAWDFGATQECEAA
jgi:hypothetical protein